MSAECRRVQGALTRGLDLDDAMREHLRGCDACAQVALALTLLEDDGFAVEDEALDAWADTQLPRWREVATPVPPVPMRPRSWVAGAVGVALAAAIAAAWVPSLRRTPPALPPEVLRDANETVAVAQARAQASSVVPSLSTEAVAIAERVDHTARRQCAQAIGAAEVHIVLALDAAQQADREAYEAHRLHERLEDEEEARAVAEEAARQATQGALEAVPSTSQETP